MISLAVEFRFAAFALYVLGAVPFVDSAASESDTTQNKNVFSMHLGGVQPIQSAVFEIGSVKPGDSVEAVVLINNDTATHVKLDKVELTCKCTVANVPNTTIEDGAATDASFQFTTRLSPRVREEVFGAMIFCSGGRNAIKLGFKVRYEGLVAFDRPEFVFPFRDDLKSPSSFHLPIVYESEELLRDTVIESRGELARLMRSKIAEANGKYFVECTFLPSDVHAATAVGEIVLRSKSGFQSEILCTLSKEKAIEILPSRIVFRTGETQDIPRHATAILKVRDAPGSSKSTNIIAISCLSPDNIDLPTSFAKLGKDVYRVRVTLEKAEDFKSDGKIKWTLKTDLGEEINIHSNWVLSN